QGSEATGTIAIWQCRSRLKIYLFLRGILPLRERHCQIAIVPVASLPCRIGYADSSALAYRCETAVLLAALHPSGDEKTMRAVADRSPSTTYHAILNTLAMASVSLLQFTASIS